MNRPISSFVCIAVLITTFHVRAATLTLNTVAHATFNAADGGPPTTPLITDEQGNVLNPAVGQVYEIFITMSISDFVELPNGNIEKGFAGADFQVQLNNLQENLRNPGWQLAQKNIDLRPGPGGCCVPLWLDLCNCGVGGPLDDIAIGIDVADFPRAAQIGNPEQDPRRTVGQGYPPGEGVLLGRVFVDYLGGFGSLQVRPGSFQVHDLENVYSAVGVAIGDTLTFVPEPSAWLMLFLCAMVAIVFTMMRFAFRPSPELGRLRLDRERVRSIEYVEDRRLLATMLDLTGTQSLTSVAPTNVTTYLQTSVPQLSDTHQDETAFAINPLNPLMIAGVTHRIIPNSDAPGDPEGLVIDVMSSNDGGVTWNLTPIDATAEVMIDDPEVTEVFDSRYDPFIDYDASGNLFVVYARTYQMGVGGPYATDLVVAGRDMNGLGFDHFEIVEQVAGGFVIHQPRLTSGKAGAQSNANALYVVYNSFLPNQPDVRLAGANNIVNSPSGVTFSFSQLVYVDTPIPPPTPRISLPDVAVGPMGDTHVEWHVDDTSGTLLYDVDKDGLWESNFDFGADQTAVALTKSLFNEQVPAAPDKGIHAGPVLDIDQSNGRLYLAYVDCPQTGENPCSTANYVNYDVFVRSLDTRTPGAQWSNRVKVDASTGTEFLPWLTVDQTTGAVYVVYYSTELDQAGGHKKAHVKLAMSNDRGLSFARTQLSTTPSDETPPPPPTPDPNPDDYLEYIGLAARDGTAHAFWAANTQPFEYLDAWHAAASFTGAAAGVNNVLYVTGDESGAPTNDTINVSVYRATPTSPEWVQVFVNGTRQFTGLRSSITKIYVFGLGGTDNITIDPLLSSMAFQASNSAPRVHRVSVVDQAGQDEYIVPARDRVHDAGEQLRTVPIYLPKQIKIKFTEGMLNVAANRFTITTHSGTPVPFTAVYTSSTHTATLTLTNTIIAAQQLVVTALDTLRDLSNVRLDGNWTNPTWINTNDGDAFPSGDGAALGNFVFRLMFVPGDADRNGVVDIPDLNAVRNNFGAPTPVGLVDRWLFGDVTQDGQVAIEDLNEVRNNFGLGFTGWGQLAGGGGGMMMMSGGGGTVFGEESLRQALRDYYYARLSGQEKNDDFDGLLYWDLLGDEEWWKITLGGE